MPQLAQTTTPELVPPDGGTLHRLNTELTRYRTWKAAINAGAPETSSSNTARRVERFFEAPVVWPQPARLVLLWMGHESVTSTRRANVWALDSGLLLTSPYEVFALSAKFPCLYEEYGLAGGGFVATQTCELPKPHICGVWQSQKRERRASLEEIGLKFYDRTMFVYREQ